MIEGERKRLMKIIIIKEKEIKENRKLNKKKNPREKRNKKGMLTVDNVPKN